MIDLLLPQLEPGATEATVEQIFVQPADTIAAGQPVAIVRTERFAWDIPATTAGTIAAISSPPGARVPIGAALVRLHEHPANVAEAPAQPLTAHPCAVRATPVARKIAAIHTLDLASISGSGRHGLITRADVQRVIQGREHAAAGPGQAADRFGATSAAPVQFPGDRSRDPLAPTALSAINVDFSAVTAFVERRRARGGQPGAAATIMACVAQSVIAALHEYRTLNSAWSAEGMIVRGRVRLGVVCGAPATLHVIDNAADLNAAGIARMLHENIRAGAHNGPPAPGATFTIVEGAAVWSAARLPADHAATLVLGTVVRQPTVVQAHDRETIAIRPGAVLTLVYDARIIDQPLADAFLVALKRRLERFNGL